MLTSIEKITISGNKSAEVYLHKTEDNRFIVSIPEIHWSAEFNDSDELLAQADHLQSSLNYHLFEGNTEILVNAIINLVGKYRKM